MVYGRREEREKMNRQIEFRGKRLDNGEWVCGYYVKYGFIGREKHYIVPDFASDLYVVEVDQSTVGQFTGLVDKDMKRIYEHDIIKGHEWEKGKSHRHIGIVEYIGSSFRSVGINKYLGFHGSVDGSYEVIGNIFDRRTKNENRGHNQS